ncbi:SH3 domain-containing protein [Hyphobacterium sp.]|uniref:SH3 domain-containing protein n=1 Tax=Hyphobacterium sp. TaxID=2004662 RepID=UPI003BA948D1
MKIYRLVLAIMVIACPTPALWAQQADTPSGFPVPRFVSLKVGVAHGRSGPSQDHPIAWRYVRAGLPLRVTAEAPGWRRVEDPDGEVTWMHQSLLSGRRTVYIPVGTELRIRPDEEANIEAIVEPGAILDLERCAEGGAVWKRRGIMVGRQPIRSGEFCRPIWVLKTVQNTASLP